MSAIASRLRTICIHAGAGLLAAALLWLLSASSVWRAMEYKFFDAYTQLAAPGKAPLPIVILAIDEPTFQELRMQWPFPRRLHGRIVERLHADGAAAIGFDVVFAEPSNAEDDKAFADAIGAAGNVVLAASHEKIDNGNTTIWTDVRPLPRFLQAGAIAGYAGVMPDDDFVVRRHDWRDDTLASRMAGLVPQFRSADPGVSSAMIEYLGPRNTFDTRSYYQALEPGFLPPGFFKDKIVLIGRSARAAGELQARRADMFNSPFAIADGGDRLFPGVEIQATLLSNRLTGGGLQPAGAGWIFAVGALLAACLSYVGATARVRLALAAVAAASAGVALLSFFLFAHQKLWFSPWFPIAALVAAHGVSTLVNYAAARKRSAQIRTMFSQYVPPEVVARLIERPGDLRLGGEVREITLMFTDLADFTAMSEKLSAEQTVEVLTEYFNVMTSVIHRAGGTIDKFIGDAIMAFWGAPLRDDAHAEHAVQAAIEMQASMRDLVGRLRKRGLPPISMRIGIHTGRVVVGNVGARSRFSYTAIGDAVNLAARLESENKVFGTSILVSEETASRLSASFRLRHLDSVTVKGKTRPIDVFTPCEDAEIRMLSAKALAASRKEQWAESRSAIQAILARSPNDRAASRLLERIAIAEGSMKNSESSIHGAGKDASEAVKCAASCP
ncbi:MAG TPA: adenylate/guanylate cyclase domain-containing protein [Paucimonas sp.]|nr:adenylate/guanylate cyclase domain-containing protein [Paucimonas sp.]